MLRFLNPFRVLAVVLPLLLVATLAFKAGQLSQQPHMRAAWESLQGAKKHLEEAADDKGGHRLKAIGLVRDAIAEVQAGIQYARAH